MDHDADMIGVVQCRGAAIEGGVSEIPLRRSELPDEPGKVAPVLLVPGPPAFRGEVVLVPPLELGLGRQRRLVGFATTDQIATHRDQPSAPFRPDGRNDVGSARAPVEPADHGPPDLESVHQRNDVHGDH
jgi:hypothetical protein